MASTIAFSSGSARRGLLLITRSSSCPKFNSFAALRGFDVPVADDIVLAADERDTVDEVLLPNDAEDAESERLRSALAGVVNRGCGTTTLGERVNPD